MQELQLFRRLSHLDPVHTFFQVSPNGTELCLLAMEGDYPPDIEVDAGKTSHAAGHRGEGFAEGSLFAKHREWIFRKRYVVVLTQVDQLTGSGLGADGNLFPQLCGAGFHFGLPRFRESF